MSGVTCSRRSAGEETASIAMFIDTILNQVHVLLLASIMKTAIDCPIFIADS